VLRTHARDVRGIGMHRRHAEGNVPEAGAVEAVRETVIEGRVRRAHHDRCVTPKSGQAAGEHLVAPVGEELGVAHERDVVQRHDKRRAGGRRDHGGGMDDIG
jgi:hypothetical protein